MPQPFIYHEKDYPEPITLRYLHEVCAAFCEQIFDLQGRIPGPMWLMAEPKKITWICTPWADDVEKVASFDVIRVYLERHPEIMAYSFAGEVYATVAHSLEEAEAITKSGSIANLPKGRVDSLLLVSSYSRARGEPINTTWLINEKAGLKNTLGVRDDDRMTGVDGTGGRAFDLFRPETHVLAVAREHAN
jgi:hypothetical protein